MTWLTKKSEPGRSILVACPAGPVYTQVMQTLTAAQTKLLSRRTLDIGDDKRTRAALVRMGLFAAAGEPIDVVLHSNLSALCRVTSSAQPLTVFVLPSGSSNLSSGRLSVKSRSWHFGMLRLFVNVFGIAMLRGTMKAV